MSVDIQQEAVTVTALEEYAAVSIAFVVDRILQVTVVDGGLGGRDDIAVLWDIRVSPGERSAGLGSALFQVAADWAVARGCGWLKIETQNVNAGACRFYHKMGCTLGAIDRFAYPEAPGEVQLLWWKALELPPD